MQCQLFDSPAQALREILKTSPRVIAFGESHAQRGSEGVESSALRFMRDFLPVLKETSSDLVLELMVADGSCGAKTEAKVEAKQKPVTAPQRESNQNEFLVLGQACQAAGVRPHVIRPSCGDYQRIAQAGDDSIDQMLTLIADESARLVRAILERNLKQGKDRTVLTYGGALHNDILPRAGYEAWSFGPRLSKLVGGRYIEIDLIVREFIRDTETWKAMPWYAHFDKTAHPQRVTLFRPTPQSYALIFAASGPPHESGATGAGTAPPSGVAGTSAPSRGRHP